MRLYTEGGYTREERLCFAELNRTNTVRSIQVILSAMGSLGIPLQHKGNEHHAHNILIYACQAKERYSIGTAISVSELWADAGVQEAFKRRHEYHLMDNLSYSASHIQRLVTPEYKPSQEDILRSRFKTTGITETSIHLGDKIFRVFNVGGVWSERKKWTHIFIENVDSIVFTVHAYAYCLMLEYERVNRMQEQLELWGSIVNSRRFANTNFVLVFTKVDSLPETIEVSPISQYFPDFHEPANSPGMAQLIDSYLAFLREKFISIMDSEAAREQTQVVFADLVHVEDNNPGGLVLEHLKTRSAAQV